MHLSILTLVPLASAAAILSRQEGPSTIGYWNAYYSTDVAPNGDASRNVTAVYHNEKHGIEIVSKSLTVRPAGKPETETHTNENFKFYWADDWETPGTKVLYFEQEKIVLGPDTVWVQGKFSPGDCKEELGSVCSAETKVEISAAMGGPTRDPENTET